MQFCRDETCIETGKFCDYMGTRHNKKTKHIKEVVSLASAAV